MRIVACVVTYNRKDKLRKCIQALLSQTYGEFDILVVDNASTDGTRELIETKFGGVHYYNTGSNLGGAGGFNIAFKKTVLEYDYLWIMDDDTYPEKDALEQLVIAGKVLQGKFGYLSSLAKWTDGTSCIMNRQKIKSDLHENLFALENDLLPIESASFVSLFVNSSEAKKKGLPIKEFFIWGDDTEYTLRLREAGGYLALNSVVIHDMASNSGIDVVTSSVDRIQRFTYQMRNRIYIEKHHGTLKSRARAYMSPLKQIVRILLFAKDNKGKRVNCILRGVGQGIKFNPRIEMLNKNC